MTEKQPKTKFISLAQSTKEALKRSPWTLDKDRYCVRIIRFDENDEGHIDQEREFKLGEKLDFPVAKEGERVDMFRMQDYSIDIFLPLPNGTKVKKLFVGIRSKERVSYIGYKLEDSPGGVPGLEGIHYFKDSKPGEDAAAGEERERFITKDMMPYFSSLFRQLPKAYDSLKKGIEQLEVRSENGVTPK
ncbi:MAG: hypothetical protein Q8P80_02255 [Candidatus Levybacteria bacterium]|nr:hypothetical protein [Candidatus Levybacteria bacterium]